MNDHPTTKAPHVRLSILRRRRVSALCWNSTAIGVFKQLELLERGPGQGQARGAGIAEAGRGLGLVALPADLEDDALAERRVLDVVARAQADVLRVGLGRRVLAAPGVDRRVDHAL